MKNAALITHYLNAWGNGDSEALAKVIPFIRPTLERIARSRVSRERANHTLDSGDLINELYIKLMYEERDWSNRAHFYAVASKLMSQILVDYARKYRAEKRGNEFRVDLATGGLEDVAAEESGADHMIALDDALHGLRTFNPQQAQILEWTYFLGLKQNEIAAAMNISERTLRRELAMAKAYVKAQVVKGGVS